MVIYVGDSRDIIKRLRTNHCSGNVEGSALRKLVAEAMGYRLKRTRRASGTTRIRIDLPNPRVGEAKVTEYIRSGTWRFVICQSYNEAHDFQWYAIEQLHPLLNRDRRSWDRESLQRYRHLLTQLSKAQELKCSQLQQSQSGPGIYVLYHRQAPSKAST